MQANENLTNVTQPEWSSTWSSFLLNIQAVRNLGVPNDPASILAAGEPWNGEGWTTGRAGKVLYEITGVPLVSSNVEDNKGSFLYALALHWSLDVANFNLTEKAAEAAFALAGIFSDKDEDYDAMEQEDDESEVDQTVFSWEAKAKGFATRIVSFV